MSQNQTKTEIPAYITFVAALRAKAEALGVPLEYSEGTETGLIENKRFVCFQSKLNAHKLYVPKSAAKMGACETTVEAAVGTPLGTLTNRKGEVRVNGKIKTVVPADQDILEEILILLADDSTRLPANRKPPGKAKAATATAPEGTMDDVLSGQ